jgi:hypothetical protein
MECGAVVCKSRPFEFVKLSRLLNPAREGKRLSVLLKFYADESYNNRTFNFGGWMAEESTWAKVEKQWSARIEYERRKHGKLERYHASDCASLKRDYEGWTVSEQILHTKKLMGIMTRKRADVVAMSFGLDMAAMARVFSRHKGDPMEGTYNICVRKLMMMIHRLVRHADGYRVAIIHDHTNGYDGVILNAFNSMMDDPAVPHFRKLFTTIAPMRWQDCVPLQPADMIAFDTFKLIDGAIYSTARLRKSLQAMVGQGVRVAAHHFNEAALLELKRRHQMNIDKAASTSGV